MEKAVPALCIAQIIEATLGGTGRHVLDIIDGLHAHQVHTIHLIHSLHRADATYRQRLQQPRPWLTVGEAPMQREISLIQDVASVMRIVAYLRRHGPFDVVHVHSSKAAAVGAFAARVAQVRRIVFTPNAFASSGAAGRQKLFYLLLERLCGRLAHRVVVVSQDEHAYALQHGIAPADRVRLVPNSISPPDLASAAADRARLRAGWGIAEQTRLIGSIGRLTAQKDPHLFIEVIARRAARYPAHEEMYFMGGSGELAGEVQALVAQHGIASRVILTGHRTDVDAVLSSLDIYVLHSRYEGMPYVVLEAMGHALPIVSTRVAGVAELLQNARVIAEPRDAVALDLALDRLVDPAVRRTIGAANRMRLESNYSIESMIHALLQVYLD